MGIEFIVPDFMKMPDGHGHSYSPRALLALSGRSEFAGNYVNDKGKE